MAGSTTGLLCSYNKIVANNVPQYGINLNGGGVISFNEIRGYTNGSGGGIYCANNSTYSILNNTIVKCLNGIHTDGYPTGTLTVQNNIIACEVGGYTGTNTYGIYKYSSPTINSTYNDIYACDNRYSSNVSQGTGDIFTDPQFVDATANNFYLLSTSPCLTGGLSHSRMGAYSATIVTKVGSAANWAWQTVTVGSKIGAGLSSNSWTWRTWTPNSGRYVPNGGANTWIWINE